MRAASVSPDRSDICGNVATGPPVRMTLGINRQNLAACQWGWAQRHNALDGLRSIAAFVKKKVCYRRTKNGLLEKE